MEIREHVPLAPYTTFKIGGPARFFCVVNDQFDALQAYDFAREKNVPVFVLAGGSNVLISDAGFEGLVMKLENRGIEVAAENADEVLLKIAAGHPWDEVVQFAVRNNWWGVENLSHIPGSTGAIAVQNVGAYGQEASQVLRSVTVLDTTSKEITELQNADCKFAYRASIFNRQQRGKYLIFYVTLRLQKNGQPNLSYTDIREYFASSPAVSLPAIRQAVIEIRNKKFPYPTQPVNGNAGSFFRGPVIPAEALNRLESVLGDIFGPAARQRIEAMKPALQVAQGYKTPAAFLIDVCGLKGFAVGGAKVNPTQPAIVLNATGTATAREVLDLARAVQLRVYDKTGIRLHFEPEFIGFPAEEVADLGV